MNCISVFSIEDRSSIYIDPYLKDSTLNVLKWVGTKTCPNQKLIAIYFFGLYFRSTTKIDTIILLFKQII